MKCGERLIHVCIVLWPENEHRRRTGKHNSVCGLVAGLGEKLEDSLSDHSASLHNAGLVCREGGVRPGMVGGARDPENGDAGRWGLQDGECVPRVDLAIGVEHTLAGRLVCAVELVCVRDVLGHLVVRDVVDGLAKVLL